MHKGMMSLVGAVGVLAAVAGGALAEPSCSSNDLYCVSTSSATAGSGNPLVAVTGSPFSIYKGILEIGPKNQGAMPSFYAVFDGNSGNINPMDGYIGYNSADLMKANAVLGLVGDTKGDFQRGGGNSPISSMLAFTPDPGAVDVGPVAAYLQGAGTNLSFLQTGMIPAAPTDLVDLGRTFLPAFVP